MVPLTWQKTEQKKSPQAGQAFLFFLLEQKETKIQGFE